jgi:hypothetical protein
MQIGSTHDIHGRGNIPRTMDEGFERLVLILKPPAAGIGLHQNAVQLRAPPSIEKTPPKTNCRDRKLSILSEFNKIWVFKWGEFSQYYLKIKH